ncbi:MAG TPA: patatin-like phospholipase family protein [Paludibacteraceae bacterium]|nr:patatin-like phospholipase family protein [Paludibacteraceae bacterium]
MGKKLFENDFSTKAVGICLSGGGALGFAHIGVLQSLEEHGIYPLQVAGSSMGAVVGTLYAAGISPLKMLQIIKEDKLYRITKLMSIRLTSINSGLSTHDTLREIIRELIPHNSFDKLPKKMNVCVSNLNIADWEIVNTGENLDKWVAASASIPGIYEAMQMNKCFYVDGGLLNNFPAQALEQSCQKIIGVDVIPHFETLQLKKPTDTFSWSVRIMEHKNSLPGRKLCHFLIEPMAIKKYHGFSFDAYQKIYEEGYKSTNNYIEKNPEILNLKN